MYEYHSKITKNGELVVYLVCMKLPFSVLTVNSDACREPLFLFETKTTLLNHLASYEQPLSLLSHIFTSTMSTHTPYIIYKIDETMPEENNVPNEYRSIIHEQVEHFKSILLWNNIDLHSEKKHYIFYKKGCFECICLKTSSTPVISTPVVSKHVQRTLRSVKSTSW